MKQHPGLAPAGMKLETEMSMSRWAMTCHNQTNYWEQDLERFQFYKIYECLKPMLTATQTRRHSVGGLDVSSAFDVFSSFHLVNIN